jgi:cystine transport system permease protein
MELVLRHASFLLKGAYYTLNVTVVSMIFGFVLGLTVAVGRLYGPRWLQKTMQGYVSFVRGTPLLVKVFVVYYGLPDLGITLGPLTSAYIALSIDVSAYLSETFRGSILSVPSGQYDASRTLGMTGWQTLRRVVLPIAFRVAIPPMGNTFVGMLKQSSLVSVITVTELLRSAQLLIAQYYIVMPFYLAIALVYWLMSTAFTAGMKRIEDNLARAY